MQATEEREAPVLNLGQQQIDQIVAAQKAFFNSGVTRSYTFRKAQLNVLKAAIQRKEKDILNALFKDLRKSTFDAYGTEVGYVYADISHTQRHLRQWMQTKQVNTPVMFAPASSKVIYDPLGTVLIISPWNYPFQLLFSPLVAAIAGGNTAILKPSELAPATEAVMAELIGETFEPEYIAMIRGDGQLLGPQLIERHHLGHIFYTGSTRVGSIIMQQAARQLTPVTLELGGKSPCIVDETANIEWAAKKIIWGKLMNAGQTCVSPDHVLVHEKVKGELVAAMKRHIVQMHGQDPEQSPYYGRIINKRRFQTLVKYLDGVEVLHGGTFNEEGLFFSPTLVAVHDKDHPLWREEIFGPILPIATFHNREEVLDILSADPYPLSLYLFTGSRDAEKAFVEKLRFGGGCINNTLVHLGNPDLPFGGVGYSGMGQYHGIEGFRTFTRPKSIMRSSTLVDAPLWYPPVKSWYLKVLRRLMK
ncbi:MAG TPA: aldehyde dehydrogenase family protein [Phnomibacter sp.]|nr:aldehyde dehydrogenase family protein [Phnomibacter sp.]